MTFEQWYAGRHRQHDAISKELLRECWDVSREDVSAMLNGIDKQETDGGWWETSAGANFGSSVLATIKGEQL